MTNAGPLFVTDTSALVEIVPVADAVLFDGFESAAAVTVAVFVTVPVAPEETLYVDVIVTLDPAVIVPSVHGKAVAQAPLFDTNVNPAGVVSET